MKAIGNGAKLYKSKSFVQMPGVKVRCYNGVELHNPKAKPFCLHETVGDELFTDVFAAASGIHRIACVTDMPAPTGIIRVQNIEAYNTVMLNSNAAVRLGLEKSLSGFFVKRLLLRKGDAVFYDFIPNPHHGPYVFISVFSYFHMMIPHVSIE